MAFDIEEKKDVFADRFFILALSSKVYNSSILLLLFLLCCAVLTINPKKIRAGWLSSLLHATILMLLLRNQVP